MKDQIYFSEDRQTSSWIVDPLTCRIQTSDSGIAEQITTWIFAKLVGRCVVGSTRIFSIPRNKWRESLKMLGVQLPSKNPKRVAHGIQLGRQNQIKGNVGHSRKKLKAIGDEIFRETGGR